MSMNSIARFRRRSFLGRVVLGVVLAGLPCSAALRADEAAEDEALEPFARGEDYFVHVVPATKWHPTHIARRVPTGWSAVMPTDRRSGAMKCLLESGTFEVPTRRISYVQVRLLGVVADEHRLYVASWNSGRIFDRAPGPWDKLESGFYRLQVFRLADGASLGTKAVTEGVPEIAPLEQSGAGPLELVEGGVKLYAQTIALDELDTEPRRNQSIQFNLRIPLDR